MIEITGTRMLFPALVSFKQNGKETSTFIYVDKLHSNIIIPDTSEIEDVEEFKAKFVEKYPFNRKNIIPDVPQNLERERPI